MYTLPLFCTAHTSEQCQSLLDAGPTGNADFVFARVRVHIGFAFARSTGNVRSGMDFGTALSPICLAHCRSSDTRSQAKKAKSPKEGPADFQLKPRRLHIKSKFRKASRVEHATKVRMPENPNLYETNLGMRFQRNHML